MFLSRSRFLTQIAPILVYLSLALLAHRGIIFSEGHIIHGEFIKITDLGNYFRHIYPLWNDQLSISNIFRLPDLPILAPFFGLGFALKMSTTQMMIIVSILAQTLAGISMYYAALYMMNKAYKKPDRKITLAAAIAGIIYMWSPYWIAHSVHTLFMLAYGIAPLLLLCLVKGIEERKIKYVVLAGLLWSLTCTDSHWIVYGAVLVGVYFIYNFLFTYVTKAEALASSIYFHSKSALALVGSYMCFSAYWLVPGQLMGGASLYPHTFTLEESINFWFTNASLINILRGHASYLIGNKFTPVPQSLSSAPMETAIILFSGGVFIIAILALILKPKNRHVLYLCVFLVVSILLTSGPRLSTTIYSWFVFHAPLHSLYGWAFKTPEIGQFVILCFSFLSAFTLREILNRARNLKLFRINLHKGVILAVVLLVFISVFLPSWPLATGDFNGALRPINIPQEFEAVNSWLREQSGDFKVLWMPKYLGAKVFWNQGNPTKRFDDMYSAKPTYLLLSASTQDVMANYYSFYTGDPYCYSSLLCGNETKELGSILASLGIKYVILHDDMPSQYWETRNLLNNLQQQDDMELVKREGFVWVFENKSYNNLFSISGQNFLISGGLNILSGLSSAPAFESASTGLVLTDQKLIGGNRIEPLWDGLINDGNVEKEDLIFSLASDTRVILPFRGTAQSNPAFGWSRTTVTANRWQAMIQGLKLSNWQFDYGKGLVFTYVPNTLDMSFSVDQTGSYNLFIRYLENHHGGILTIQLDGKPLDEIATESASNDFVWRNIGILNLGQGKHELSLGNTKGFNAVNMFAILPSDKAIQYEHQADEWAKNRSIVYILEAESGFYYQGTGITEEYNPEASNGKVMQFPNLTTAWRDIEILANGYYQVAAKLDGSVQVSIDNRDLPLSSASLGYVYAAPVYLNKGTHRINIWSTNVEGSYVDVLWLYSASEKGTTVENVLTPGEDPAQLISYQKIDATKYRVEVNASQPFMLSFAESYDPLWVAKVNGREYGSLPFYSAVNGFWIDDQGALEITIEYKPQRWFYYGAGISGASFFVLLAYLFWDWRRGGNLKRKNRD